VFLKKFTKATAVAAVAAFALIASACSASSGESSGSGRDDTFVVALASEPAHLQRMFLGELPTGLVGLAMEESLVTVSRDGEILPQLAESWDSPDDTTYVFHLREGVLWHDGEEFTAEDVVYTFENAVGITGATVAIDSLVDSVSAPDEHTVEVKLAVPSAAFLSMLNPATFSILPEHIFAESENIQEDPAIMAPVGTGPYAFSSWENGRITLDANEDYWGEKPKFKQVVFTVIGDPSARAIALRNGDIDYINSYDVSAEALKQLEDQDGITLDTGRAAPSLKFFAFNTRTEALSTPEVRRALFQGIDREFISESVYDGRSPAATSPFSSKHWTTSDEVNYSESLPFDPDAAGAALDEAGYPAGADGTRFSLVYRYSADEPGGDKAAEIVADNWRAIGIDVTLMQDDAELFRQEVFANHNFDVYTINITASTDPAISVYNRYTCDNGQNRVNGNAGGFCDPALDELFAQANMTVDRDQRTAMYTEAAKTIEAQLPTGVLVEVNYTDAIRADLTGIEGFLNIGEVVALDWSAIGPADK
jgi:peptide/nickel transport system substrate-binding protein